MRFLILPVVICLSACGADTSSHQKEKRTQEDIGTLASAASYSDIYPLADGCAYVRRSGGPDDTIWYVCGDSASRVTGAKIDASNELFPLADGGALVNDGYTKKLYYLREKSAKEVTEGVAEPKLSSAKLLQGFNFVTAMMAKRTKAQDSSNYQDDRENDDHGL